MTQKQYNLYNFEALFRDFLLAGIISQEKKLSSLSAKNYLSDIRHFFGWLTLELQSKRQSNTLDEKNIIGLISRETILNYRSYLTDNNLPRKTINRRLSTIRKFCSFCISQGWMKENPAKQIKNVELRIKNNKLRTNNDPLSEYQSFLEENNVTKEEVDRLLIDIKEFINLSDITLSQQVIS